MSEFEKELEQVKGKIVIKEGEIKTLKQYQKSLEIAIAMKKKVAKSSAVGTTPGPNSTED